MKNKKGQVQQMFIGIIFIAIVSIIAIGFVAPEKLPFLSVGSDAEIERTGCQESSGTVSFGSIDTLDKSESVATSERVKVDGASPATSGTAYTVGDSLSILWSNSTYIDRVTTVTIPCGTKVIEPTNGYSGLYKFTAPTIRLFNTNGDIISDNGGATNQTAINAGGNANIEIKMDGVDKESTGSMVCVLEHTNTSAVNTITLSGLGGATKTDVPGFYSVSSAGSKAVAYKLPAIVGAKTVSGTVGVQMKSGEQYPDQAITMTCYGEQAFEDIDGTFVSAGVEDSDEIIKYTTSADFVLYVDA